MNIIDKALRGLNKAVQFANDIAFGRYDFNNRPIGLLNKSYDFLLSHLYRNIGNMEFTYDGYATPIGEISNPFYNTITRQPYFLLDNFKNSTSNYLEYIRNVYGETLSIQNINTFVPMMLDESLLSVGSIDTAYLTDYLTKDIEWESFGLVLNPNGLTIDTMSGVNGAKYTTKTLRNAVLTNDRNDKSGKSITEGVRGSFGFKTSAIDDNNILAISDRLSPDTGRFESLSPIMGYSPIDSGNTGTFADPISINAYGDFYNALSENQKQYIKDNISLNKYYPRFTLNDNASTTGDTSLYSEFRGRSYLSSIGIVHGHAQTINNETVVDLINKMHSRYVFEHDGDAEAHRNIRSGILGDVYVYSENQNGQVGNYTTSSFNSGTRFGRYTSYGELLTFNDLLKKTNDAFKNAKYDTLIARFYGSEDNEIVDTDDVTQTAVSKKYGVSHGRNLLKREPDDSEGYKNPYCRVWTHHHQYHRLVDAIRPMKDWTEKYKSAQFTANHGGSWGDGRTRLNTYGVLNQENGLVNITPKEGTSRHGKVDIRNCMFSIENLAWRDVINTSANEGQMSGGLSSEQRGPFGGRIMWFPPYNISFSEQVSVDWNPNNIIGRGEPIFTYSNTRRTGTLSFTLLIDHPSVLNYWANRGKSYSDSVDEIDDPEQEILRFFAGCDDLSSTQPTPPEPEPVIQDDPIPTPKTRKLMFYVFYPNNYSGVDDNAEDAMKYLLNGFGAGKSDSGGTSDVFLFQTGITVSGKSGGYGGYEVRPGYGISLGANITNKSTHFADLNVGSRTIPMYVQKGSSTKTWWQRKWYYRVDKKYQNQLLKKESYFDSASFGLNGKYSTNNIIEHYSIEEPGDLFSFADVYVALMGGNSTDVLNGFYDPERVEAFKAAIEGENCIEKIDIVGKASVQGYSSANKVLQRNRANTVRNWLMKTIISNKVNKDNVTCSTGGVGGQGAGVNKGDESALINKIYRCAEVSIYVKVEETKTEQNIQSNMTKVAPDNSEPKESESGNVNTTKQYVIGTMTGNDRVRYFNDYSENKEYSDIDLDKAEKTMKLRSLGDNLGNLIMNVKESSRDNNLSINGVFNSVVDFAAGVKADNRYIEGSINSLRSKMNDDRIDFGPLNEMHNEANSDTNGLYNSVEDKVDADDSAVAGTLSNTSGNGYRVNKGSSYKPQRYDMESKFFELLGKEEPFLHHKISDKVKYFDPAFHSVSPEGFNARLTFLHQCTRQGPTISASDASDAGRNNTANNMSFGRPPVCILRIGDFYYTKIIINSLDIRFDPMTWDLNHEGIGVMPMIANVDISFDFLGGSSLSGHIARLQNAVSFNYYANTEVYDDRSELMKYNDNGDKIVDFKGFNPS